MQPPNIIEHSSHFAFLTLGSTPMARCHSPFVSQPSAALRTLSARASIERFRSPSSHVTRSATNNSFRLGAAVPQSVMPHRETQHPAAAFPLVAKTQLSRNPPYRYQGNNYIQPKRPRL